MENEEILNEEINNDEKIVENHEDINNLNIDSSNFSGYFHERDRLDHNNIVDEVKTSFMEYSMSVIASRA